MRKFIAHAAWPFAALAVIALGGCATGVRPPSPVGTEALIDPAGATPAAPTSAAGHYVLGRGLQADHRDADAVKAYRRALQLDPAHVDAKNGIAVIYARRGHHALAIAMWRELLAATGESAGHAYLLNNLGYAYFLDRQLGPAVTALEKAVAFEPGNPGMLHNLGQALYAAAQAEK